MPRTPRTVKIVQKGWENFSGQLGTANFVKGVSAHPLDVVTIDRIAVDLQIVDADSKELLGVQHRMIASQCVRLNSLDTLKRASEVEPAPEPAPAPVEEPKPAEESPHRPDALKWTEESLMAIADDQGIKGLRAVGDPMGAKGRAIPELIDNILKAQSGDVGTVVSDAARED